MRETDRAVVGRPKGSRHLAAGLIEEHGSALQPTARCDATFNYSRHWEPPRLSALYGR
jgi:hypothetical protein